MGVTKDHWRNKGGICEALLGQNKKMPFSLEKKEKNIIFASEGLFTFDIGL
jgi:hypothetical protein